MTNQQILKIAMMQSAVDLCAEPASFVPRGSCETVDGTNKGEFDGKKQQT